MVRDRGCSVLFISGDSPTNNFNLVVKPVKFCLLNFIITALWLELFGIEISLIAISAVSLVQKFCWRDFPNQILMQNCNKTVGNVSGKSCIIPHGKNSRFWRASKLNCDTSCYGFSSPLHILYVSIINQRNHL